MPEDVVMSFNKDSQETRTYVTLGKTSDPQIVVPVYQTGENSRNVTWEFSVSENSANIIDKVQAVDDPEDSAHVADVYLKGGLEGLGEGRIQFATSKVVDGEGNEIYAGATRNMTIEVKGKTPEIVLTGDIVESTNNEGYGSTKYALDTEKYGTWKPGGVSALITSELVSDGQTVTGYSLTYKKSTTTSASFRDYFDGDDVTVDRVKDLVVSNDGTVKVTAPGHWFVFVYAEPFVGSDGQVYEGLNGSAKTFLDIYVGVNQATPEIDIACDAALQMRPGESQAIGATSAATEDGATIEYASDNEEVAKVVDGAAWDCWAEGSPPCNQKALVIQ